jgi:hypothetical protein
MSVALCTADEINARGRRDAPSSKLFSIATSAPVFSVIAPPRRIYERRGGVGQAPDACHNQEEVPPVIGIDDEALEREPRERCGRNEESAL